MNITNLRFRTSAALISFMMTSITAYIISIPSKVAKEGGTSTVVAWLEMRTPPELLLPRHNNMLRCGEGPIAPET